MRAVRTALGAAGVALALWGGWLLFSRQDFSQLLSTAVWLAAVVVVHDGALTLWSVLRSRRQVPGAPGLPAHDPHEGAT